MEDQITIALPVYKRTDFIRSALNSAVNQTVKCRVLLIDNNSPHDEFKKIVDEYNNPLIKYIKTDHTVPQDENFNNCFRYAETPWVTVLHDDDALHCQLVEFAKELLDRYPDQIGGIACQAHVGQEEWEGIHQITKLTNDIKILKPAYFYFSNPAFPGMIVQKDIALKIGGFKVELHPIADFDFWYRYSKETNFVMINQELAFYRVSASQSTNLLINDMINNVFRYRFNMKKDIAHAHFITRLAIGQSLVQNISHFQSNYPEFKFTLEPEIEKKLSTAKKLRRYKFLVRVFNTYRRLLSYSKLKAINILRK
ncbi:MAG: glycosyltransferase family 2 protein [Bacteroidales bacterium]|nr:glycosyltransferase family 2 protein [Bacteroidales bacterium]